MTADKLKPDMPDEIWAHPRMNWTSKRFKDNYPNGTKYIRADLARPEAKVDVEGLKKKRVGSHISSFEKPSPAGKCMDDYQAGWNDCIDHLASQGHLRQDGEAMLQEFMKGKE